MLNSNDEDNEIIVIGYVNYGYNTILIDENNNPYEVGELIKHHQRFIMNKIKDGDI